MMDRVLMNKKKKTYKNILYLLFVLILGSLLRFYRLNFQSLWLDEIYTAIISNQKNVHDLLVRVSVDTNPPAYYMFMHYILKYFEASETVLRFPSAVAGSFSILAIYWLAKSLYSQREALIAALVFSLFWTPIYFSQEARSYSILLLTLIFANLFFFDILKKLILKNKKIKWSVVAYVLTVTIACYLHYFSVLILGTQFILAIFVGLRTRSMRIVYLIYGAIIIFYLPWLIMALNVISPTSNYGWNAPPGFFKAFYRYMLFLFNGSTIFLLIAIVVYLHYFAQVMIRVKNKSFQKDNYYYSDLFLCIWAILPILIVYIKSIISEPIFVNRYLIISLPAFYLLFARAVTDLLKKLKPAAQALVIGIFVLGSLSHLFWGLEYYTQFQKQGFREVTRYIAQRDSNYQNSIIVTSGNIDHFEFYLKRNRSVKRVEGILNSEKSIQDILRRMTNERISYLWYLQRGAKDQEWLTEKLKEYFYIFDHKIYAGDMSVWLLKMKEKA
jgi:mannosyltransferase